MIRSVTVIALISFVLIFIFLLLFVLYMDRKEQLNLDRGAQYTNWFEQNQKVLTFDAEPKDPTNLLTNLLLSQRLTRSTLTHSLASLQLTVEQLDGGLFSGGVLFCFDKNDYVSAVIPGKNNARECPAF